MSDFRSCVLDGVNHVHAHLHTAARVVLTWVRHARHAVVTVAQDLDPQTRVVLKKARLFIKNI